MPFPLISGEIAYNIPGDPGRVPLCPPAKTAEGKSALDAIWARKRVNAKKSQKIGRIVGLVSFIATPVCLYYFGPKLWTYGPSIGLDDEVRRRGPGRADREGVLQHSGVA